MDNEVKIIVNQEGRGSALADVSAQIDQTKAKVAQLRTEAAQLRANAETYAKKYGFNDSTARSARAEATGLDREANRLEQPLRQQTLAEEKLARKDERDARAASLRAQREEARLRKEAVREEARERKAVASAQTRGVGRAVAGGVNAFEGAAGIGGLGGMAGMTKNPAALLVTMIATAVGGHVGQWLEKIASKRRSEEQAGFATGRRNLILSRTDPTLAQGEAGSEVSANAAALEEAQSKKGKFTDTEPFWDFLKGGVGMETSGQKKERENQQNIDRLSRDLPGDAALAEQKFRDGPGGAELESRRAGLRYDMEGKRFADDKVAAMKEYHRIVASMGGEHATPEAKKMAEEGATDLIRERQRERAGNVLGLVGARTGNRGAAQIARIAGGLDNPTRAGEVFAAALNPLHETVKSQAQPLRNFSNFTTR